MTESTCYQAQVEFVRADPLEDDRLEDIAEAVLGALNDKTRLVALGPVVSVDFAKTSLQVDFTVAGQSVEDINRKIEHVSGVVREVLGAHETAAGFEYNSSRTDRLVTA